MRATVPERIGAVKLARTVIQCRARFGHGLAVVVDEYTNHVGDLVGFHESRRQADADTVQRRVWTAVPGPFHQLMQCHAVRWPVRKRVRGDW